MPSPQMGQIKDSGDEYLLIDYKLLIRQVMTEKVLKQEILFKDYRI